MANIFSVLETGLFLVVLKTLFLSLALVLPAAASLTLFERKWSAFIQDRRGPGRANIGKLKFFGFFHVIADGLKSMSKEDCVPKNTNLLLFTLAPFFALISGFSLLALLPISSSIGGFDFYLGDVHLGGIAILAFSSLGVYGTIFAGWSTDNKYGMLGAARASAQIISYEVFLGISLISLFFVVGSFRILDVVAYQNEYWFGVIPKWGIFVQPLGFLLVFIALLAEMKRAPFDAPEGESEIVAGYFIEYSGMRFASFFLAEYIAVVGVCALLTTLYLGSYHIPFLMDDGFRVGQFFLSVPEALISALRFAAFVTKVAFLSWLILVLRWSLPRFRFDQTMQLGWNRLLPLGILNALLTIIFILL